MAIVFTQLYQSILDDRKKAMAYVENAIRRVAFHRTPQQKRWSENIKNNAEGIVYLGMGKKLPQPQIASEETMKQERASWNEDLKKQYESKIACFLKTCEKPLAQTGLAENECVELERFTYLEEPFNWIPKHTTAFYRRTNMSEFVVIIIGNIVRTVDVRNESGSQELIYYDAPCPPLKTALKARSGSGLKGIAKSLGEGLLGGVYGCVGALIFNEIFPPGTPTYFNEVYKEIENIVNKALTNQTIDEINAQINSMKDWIAMTYANAKKSETMKEEDLTDLLQPREPELAIELVGVLMDDRYAEPGIGVFMIGAGMHLTVLQELAMVDPNAEPNDSFYIDTIKQRAQSYADFAKSTTDAIINKRLGMIQPKGKYWHDAGVSYDEYWYVDDFTGQRGGDYLMWWDSKGTHDEDASDNRNRDMEKHKNDVKTKLVADMEDPKATADQWMKLIGQPLPPL